MSYVIPAGFSRLSFTYAPVSPLGSALTWGVGVESPPSPAILAEISSWYVTEFNAELSEFYTLTRMEMRSDTLVQELPSSLSGVRTASVGPPNTAALVRLTTGLPGRANRGRVYLPGLVAESEANAQGEIDATRLGQLQDLWDGFVAVLEDLSAPLVILHSTSSDPTPVLNSVLQGNVATQRRRQRA